MLRSQSGPSKAWVRTQAAPQKLWPLASDLSESWFSHSEMGVVMPKGADGTRGRWISAHPRTLDQCSP